MTHSEHRAAIVDQFTKQAIPFSKLSGHSQAESLQKVLELTEVNENDHVLDIACGTGIVSCAFAEMAQQVTGIDLTPAMIEQAKKLQQEKQLRNLTWQIGDVLPLPFENDLFSLVVTRYSFHHFVNPQSVLAEMKRVCVPGGKIAVIDASPEFEKADAYNQMEKLRDPSHTRALPFAELLSLFEQAELSILNTDFYKVEMELEQQLKASFPNPGDEEKLHQLFVEDLECDRLGVGTHQRDNSIHFAYPIAVIVGQKPA